jgi:hypothetical protein
MAIYSAVPPPEQATPHTSLQAADIEAWTVQALESLQVSPRAVGTGVPLIIPLDEPRIRDREYVSASTKTYKRRDAAVRDSQKKREILLKGKEGSRRRQRWENGA